MDDVIAYAAQRGVFLFPHNESVPHYGGMKNALTQDFNSTDTFAGLLDEIDGKGPYEVAGSIPRDGDPRYWAFMKEATQRSYAQFASGWPDGKLPYYHIGPVYGEGGTTPENAVRLLGFLKEKNPDIALMYWNGPPASHPVLKPHRKNIVGAYYSRGYGAAPEQLFKGGDRIINVSADPLYFVAGWSSPRTARQHAKRICEEFHVARLNGIDCSKWGDQVLGAMLPTWEMRAEGHIEALLECVPFFAEHVWNVRPLPYPTVLAMYGIRQVNEGRRVGTKLNVKDVSSEYCQRKKGFVLERLDRFDKYEGFWLEAVVEDRRTPVPDQVWFRIDFPRWLSQLSGRDRRMAESLAAGSRPGEVARAFGMCPARISQKRREFYDSWRAFHGEGEPAGHAVAAPA